MSLKRKSLAIATSVYWFLLFYIIAALIWWFIALQNQNHKMASYKFIQLKPDDPEYLVKENSILEEENLKTAQYIGEGSTFMLVILVGAIFVYRAVRRQINLQQQQQNFMMAVTHELKTPIAVAKLNMETLQKYDLEPQQKQKFINSALQEMNRLNTLANNILVASQLEDSKKNITKEKINFSALVHNVANNAEKNSIDRNWDLHIEPELFINADGLLLQMLVNNLIENASKYSPKNSTITVELKKSNGKILFSVIDEGPGIPQQEKKKVFEKFYRIGNEATRSAPGTGLGLYLCKKIADYHKAQINISDNLPGGSIFTVTF
ncbi:MAG TPA: ATP-binding protein [Puia sp.]|jgi:two-component system sensor histidine kinase CiaH|nr:ATP-binding protein [Puia sp.]